METSKLCEAFWEAARREFANIPAEDDVDVDFSEEFELRMQKMFEQFCKNAPKTEGDRF